ncbi:MAG: hypothetical protein EOP51_07040, partial [Sphingobacteriales bacterium]
MRSAYIKRTHRQWHRCIELISVKIALWQITRLQKVLLKYLVLITTTKAFGLNFADKWNKKVDFSASYFFNQTDNDAIQNLARQYVQQTGDSGRIYTENQNAQNRNSNHRFTSRIDWKIDSTNSLLI